MRQNPASIPLSDTNKLMLNMASHIKSSSYRSTPFLIIEQRILDENNNYNQLQYMLENERKKFKQAKQKFQYDLDCQRKLRIQYENKLIKRKQELSGKLVSISELEFKVNHLLGENQQMGMENQRVNDELVRLEEVYGGKIRELEKQIEIDQKNFDDMAHQYHNQLQIFKKQGQQYIEKMQFQYQRKIKVFQQKNKILENAKKELQSQIKKLTDILKTNKLIYEQQVREMKNRVRDEQSKKISQMTKTYDQKLRLIEQTKQTVMKRNSDLQKVIQNKQKQIQEAQSERIANDQKLRQQNGVLSQQISHLNYLISKLKSQIQSKSNRQQQEQNNSIQQIQHLKEQLQSKKQQNLQMNVMIKGLKSNLKQNEEEFERKSRQFVQKCNYLQIDGKKWKDQYQKICDILKSKINQTINNVSFKK